MESSSHAGSARRRAVIVVVTLVLLALGGFAVLHPSSPLAGLLYFTDSEWKGRLVPFSVTQSRHWPSGQYRTEVWDAKRNRVERISGGPYLIEESVTPPSDATNDGSGQERVWEEASGSTQTRITVHVDPGSKSQLVLRTLDGEIVFSLPYQRTLP